jgi:hypothetical protein
MELEHKYVYFILGIAFTIKHIWLTSPQWHIFLIWKCKTKHLSYIIYKMEMEDKAYMG